MKIIFSRKGVDSGSKAGGIASPILPDGALLSLPLPANDGRSYATYADLGEVNGHSIGDLIEDLTNGRIKRRAKAHVDPDLRRSMQTRLPGWRPLFGPPSKSHTHMQRHGVNVNDLVLFFGVFRNVDYSNGKYHYVRNSPKLHVIFGWLEVERWIEAGPTGRRRAPAWARDFPHFLNSWDDFVYIATQRLSLPGLKTKFRGGGVFERYSDVLRLTAPKQPLTSHWELPASFRPRNGKPLFTYHADASRWRKRGQSALLRSCARGQEFVFDSDECPDAFKWVRKLFASNEE